MKPLPHNPDLLALAPRVIWFEPAERALSDPIRFLAYVMTYGTLQDIIVVRRYLDLDDFREALEHAPPGIIDQRSWTYWHTVIGGIPRRLCLGASFRPDASHARVGLRKAKVARIERSVIRERPRRPRHNPDFASRHTATDFKS